MREVAVALLVLLVVSFAGSAPSRLIEYDRVQRGGGPCSSDGGESFGDARGRESLEESLEEAQTGKRRAPPPACDAAQIDIGRACHCTVKGQSARPWGKMAGVSLELPKTLEVTPGGLASVPFSLRNKTKKTLELDFAGGEVITESEILRGKKRIEGPACGMLMVEPDAVRLTLRPGAVVRGALSWRAMNSQFTGCTDKPTELAPGRYRVTFETVSGTPPLRATVNVRVRARAR